MPLDFSDQEGYAEVEKEKKEKKKRKKKKKKQEEATEDMSIPHGEVGDDVDFDYDYDEEYDVYHPVRSYHEEVDEPEIPQAIVHAMTSLILNKLEPRERSFRINEESVKQVFRDLIEGNKDEYTLKIRFVFQDKRGYREYERRISITSDEVRPLKEMYERYISLRTTIRELYEEIEAIKKRVYSIEDFQRSIKSIQKRLEDEVRSSELYRLYELDRKRDEVIDRIEKEVNELEERRSIFDKVKGVISNAIDSVKNFLSGIVRAVNPFKRRGPGR